MPNFRKARTALSASLAIALVITSERPLRADGPSGASWSNVPPDLQNELGIFAPSGIKAFAMAPNLGYALVTSDRRFVARNVPQLFTDKLAECVNGGRNVRYMTFSPEGGWVIVTDQGTFWHQINNHVTNALKAAAQKNQRIHCVAFGPNEGWIVVTDRELYRGAVPPDLFDKMNNFAMQGGIQLVALAPGGGANVFASGRRFEAEATPLQCVDVMEKASIANQSIDIVVFAKNGGWVVITSRAQ